MGITKEQLKNAMISLKNYTDSKVSEQPDGDININNKAVEIDNLSYVEDTGIIKDINDIRDALIVDANNKLLEYFFNSGESLKRIIGLSKKLFENINRKLATLSYLVSNNEGNIQLLETSKSDMESRITALEKRKIFDPYAFTTRLVMIPFEDLGVTTDTIDIPSGGYKNYRVNLWDIIENRLSESIGTGYNYPVVSINYFDVVSYNNPPYDVLITHNGTYLFIVNKTESSVSIDRIDVNVTYYDNGK